VTSLAEKVEAARIANIEARKPGQPHRKGPVVVIIPFKHLVRDNQKYGVIRGRMLLRAEYRAAKDTIQNLARRVTLGKPPTDKAVHLYAKLYVPDARRRDATNYAKLVHDSLQGTVYLDDTQIKRATWEHCGIDRENPRVEITITEDWN
jgi:Holliday junction resolvase RusA-like endonuclease